MVKATVCKSRSQIALGRRRAQLVRESGGEECAALSKVSCVPIRYFSRLNFNSCLQSAQSVLCLLIVISRVEPVRVHSSKLELVNLQLPLKCRQRQGGDNGYRQRIQARTLRTCGRQYQEKLKRMMKTVYHVHTSACELRHALQERSIVHTGGSIWLFFHSRHVVLCAATHPSAPY